MSGADTRCVVTARNCTVSQDVVSCKLRVHIQSIMFVVLETEKTCGVGRTKRPTLGNSVFVRVLLSCVVVVVSRMMALIIVWLSCWSWFVVVNLDSTQSWQNRHPFVSSHRPARASLCSDPVRFGCLSLAPHVAVMLVLSHQW